MTVSGMRAARGTSVSLPIPVLTANILCTRHNERLSSLDALAADFFDSTQRNPPTGTFVTNNGHRLRTFSGPRLERWFLKLAIGLLASRNGTFPEQPDRWRPPTNLVRVLFGHESMPTPQGLYAAAINAKGVHLRVKFWRNGDGLAAMECGLGGVGFILLLSPTARPNVRALFRPSEFLRTGATSESVMLRWPELHSAERVTIAFDGAGGDRTVTA